MYTKSEIFKAYNAVKKEIKAKSANPDKAIARLNKALGILQSKSYYTGERSEYQPTISGCGCKDWEYRFAAKRGYTGACKHMIAEYMILKIEWQRAENAAMIAEMVAVMSEAA